MTLSESDVSRILALLDAGHAPVQILATIPTLTKGDLYRTLRLHRPERPRAPRRRTSLVRPKVLGLYASGMRIARIAQLVGCHEVFVYRIIAEKS